MESMTLALTNYQNATDFLQRVRSTLLEDEAVNSLILGLSQGIERNPERFPQCYLATVEDEQGLAVAAVITPPHNVLIYGGRGRGEHQEAFALLIDDLRAVGQSAPGALGRVPIVDEFAENWERLTG